jgi:hypothetical protein
MCAEQKIWSVWANFLQHWGIHKSIAIFLESAGTLSVLSGQILYVGQPLLKHSIPDTHLHAMVSICENQHERQAFIDYLREVED